MTGSLAAPFETMKPLPKTSPELVLPWMLADHQAQAKGTESFLCVLLVR